MREPVSSDTRCPHDEDGLPKCRCLGASGGVSDESSGSRFAEMIAEAAHAAWTDHG